MLWGQSNARQSVGTPVTLAVMSGFALGGREVSVLVDGGG
jgi:hypothetical protein